MVFSVARTGAVSRGADHCGRAVDLRLDAGV